MLAAVELMAAGQRLFGHLNVTRIASAFPSALVTDRKRRMIQRLVGL